MKNLFKTFVAILTIALFIPSCGPKKSELIVKNWKATELILGEAKLTAEEIGEVSFNYNADNTFEYSEPGSPKDSGSWVLNEKENTITLKYKEGNREVVQTIKELSKDKLIIDYEDHGMKRTLTLSN